MTAVLHDTISLRAVYGAFPTGVAAVAAIVDGAPVGLAASSFTTVSLTPPLVSVCMAHTSSTWPVLRRAERLGVSVLATDQGPLCRRLAGPSEERFTATEWSTTPEGAVLLPSAAAWFECSVDNEVRAGDHDIVVLRVHDLRLDRDVDPLVFHSGAFRSLTPRTQEPR
ncbi:MULTISPECIES: flavin reductase family protein [Streptomyces]|uniref:Flavin reductase family protein n=1 Tax=Streptomyces fuscus TaxID=3048495 RepID=A0ABT7J679_9ACTN|nr:MULTISPECIES: flavin reductase family protein [Streptomyces]MCM1973065.1 flavin reductase family protein [Streptomyces sp. G1]MDL2079827.1 flavin reductase family protein [Streptomyces fuscus]SBT94800.1 NADH-FMN oxidoreductase RutF, flavin reductase (DIM6/NTAB) family [Streptomyces sp. DI166]